MVQLKIGVFPGRLDDYMVEEGTTVASALAMAGITVGAEQEIKLDGETVSADDVLDSSARVLIVGKRIKGAHN